MLTTDLCKNWLCNQKWMPQADLVQCMINYLWSTFYFHYIWLYTIYEQYLYTVFWMMIFTQCTLFTYNHYDFHSPLYIIYTHRLTSIFTYQLSMFHWSVKYWLDLNIFKQILSNVTDYWTMILYSGWKLLQIDFMNIKVNE